MGSTQIGGYTGHQGIGKWVGWGDVDNRKFSVGGKSIGHFGWVAISNLAPLQLQGSDITTMLQENMGVSLSHSC